MTRQRAQLVAETTARGQSHSQDAGRRQHQVGCGGFGYSGQIGPGHAAGDLSGERDPRKLADLAKGALRRRIPELTKALQGHWTEHHTFMIRSLLNQVQYLEGEIEAFSERIDICLRPFLTAEQMERLDEIPGVNRVTVENIVAEIGTDMSRFPTPITSVLGRA